MYKRQNPDSTLKTISAFANDIDNWGGGYIVIGVKEENGKILKPITGLNEESVDHIQKEILKYCKYLKPNYVPQSEPVYYEGKMVLLIWCPGAVSYTHLDVYKRQMLYKM